MIDTAAIQSELQQAFPEASVDLIANDSPSNQVSLLISASHLTEIGKWLRDHAEYAFDYLSNVTGVDRLDEVVKEKVKKTEVVDGEEVEKEETLERSIPGYLEVVYHLYSMAKRHGPLVLRVRTGNRTDDVAVPSVTPIWRSAELQEREVFDLYGVHFDNHPDLRRLLMWDEFEDHPMRKDYQDPDDFEYEPTPHGAVLERAKAHQAADAPADEPSASS